jgi:O-acetyl-ADP-ribose deacetylase (regulator of RNase III)
MWIHRILGLPIQQRRFSRLGSSLPVARGLSLEAMRLSLSCIWWAVGSNHAASIQLMSMSLIQPAFVMSLSEIRNHGVADVASATVVTGSIKVMQFSTMYQLIRRFPW